MTAPAPDTERAFYGRRKGKTLRPLQAGRMDDLLPRLRLDLGAPAPADLRGLFPGPVDAVFLEIGFGGGEHLISEARRLPGTGFIGAEPFVNGMAKAVTAIGEAGIANIRLHNDDATPLLAWLPEASIARIDLLYPDPWPKTRHWKRRFVSDATLARFARVLKPGGVFRFASDIDSYVMWTLEHIARTPAFRWTASGVKACRTPWPHWVRTRYEAKAIREGRVPAYLVFERV